VKLPLRLPETVSHASNVARSGSDHEMPELIGELTGHIRSHEKSNKLKFPCCSVVLVVISM